MLINNKNLAKSLVVLFIFTLFFPIRHVFLTNEAYFTGTYSDFTSFSLYLSDIIIFALAVIVFLPRGGGFYHVVGTLKWLILWIILGFIVHFSLNTRFSAYFLIKWVELIVAYGTFVVLFKENPLKQLFLKLFVYFCALQSIIAIIQFAGQSPLGLFKLGESHIGPNMVGVAKIVSSGTNFIRSYGTFPHPNPFSAFLVVGILIGTYLLINSPSIKARLLHSSLIFLNILGLTLTFSRGAYLALALGLLIFFGFMFFKHLKTSFTPALVLLVSVVISFFIFKSHKVKSHKVIKSKVGK